MAVASEMRTRASTAGLAMLICIAVDAFPFSGVNRMARTAFRKLVAKDDVSYIFEVLCFVERFVVHGSFCRLKYVTNPGNHKNEDFLFLECDNSNLPVKSHQ